MTIKDILEQTAARHGDSPALCFKADGDWRTFSFGELKQRARVVSEICAEAGVRPGDRVGLYRENSPEWPELYLGITALGAVAVPVDAALREQEVLHILRDSAPALLFASARFYPVIDSISDGLPALQTVILLEGKTVLPVSRGRMNYADYHDRCKAVENKAQEPDAAYDRFGPDEEDLASIIYTSGTTGRQKGAMLTHKNFVSNVKSALQVLQPRPEDNFLLVLPLHHSFAFTGVFLLPLYTGSQVSMVENLRTLAQNMAETRPTIFMAVPLLLKKMLSRATEKPAVRLLLKLGLGHLAGKALVRKLGGGLRLMVSGAAPCDPAVLRTWERLGIPVLEGYGITETAPVLCVNPPGKTRPGTVGPAIPGVEIRIDQPNEEGVGEILARGPNVMRGYWNNPEATDEALQDGWYRTGDLGFLDKDGYLTISGRKKNLIVNREGKNIYPEEVERALLKSPCIRECLVLACRDPDDPAGERVGVIAMPDLETISGKNDAEKRLSDEDIERLLRAEIKKISGELAGYKRPRYVEVRFDEFEKTSTAKIKRHLYAMNVRGLREEEK